MAKECIVKNGLQLVEIANFTTRNYRGEIGNNKYDQAFYIHVYANTFSEAYSTEVNIVIDNKKIYSGYLNEDITFPATLYTTSEISIRVRSEMIKAITSIEFKGSTCIGSVNSIISFMFNDCGDTFNGCTSLTSLPYLFVVDDGVENFSRMFRNCYMLGEVPSIHMLYYIRADYMFANTCGPNKSNGMFEQFPNIDNEPAHFISATGMYYNAVITALPRGDFSQCTNLSNFMAHVNYNNNYDSSKSFTLDISSALNINNIMSNIDNVTFVTLNNASKVLFMDNAFSSNACIYSVSGIDSCAANSMIGTFYNSQILNNLPTINVTNTNYLLSTFKNCKGLLSLNTMDFTTIIDMSSCFEGCEKFSARPNLTSVNNVKRATSAFKNCIGLLNFSDLNLPSCVDITSMLEGCSELRQLPTLNGLSNVKYADFLFSGCLSATDSSATSYDIPNALSGVCMFANDSNLTVMPSLVSTNMTDKTGMYMNCTELTTGEATFDNVTNTSYMYYGCTSLTNVTASTSSNTTKNVLLMPHMFEGCTSLVNSPDCLDTTNAKNINCLFKNCTLLENVELTTTNLETMNGTFDGCSNLHNLTLNGTKCPSFSIRGCNFSSSELVNVIDQLPTIEIEDTMNTVDCRDNPGTEGLTVTNLFIAYNKNWQIKPYTCDYIKYDTSSTETIPMTKGYTLSDSGEIINSGEENDYGFTKYEYLRVTAGIQCKVTCSNPNIKVIVYDSNFNFVSVVKCTTGETSFTFTNNTTGYIRITCNGTEISDTVTVACTGLAPI